MRTTRPHPRQRGVTLIELMVTVAVLVILLAVGVPSFSALMAKSRVTTAVNGFIADLQLARSEAIKRGNTVQLCTSTDNAACDGDTNWHDGYIIHDAGTVLRIASEAGDGVGITTTSRTKFTFQADGTSGGSTITWKFCDAGDRTDARAIVVSNVGRPRTSYTDSSGHDLVCP